MQSREDFLPGELSVGTKQVPPGPAFFVSGTTIDAYTSILGEKIFDDIPGNMVDISRHRDAVIVIKNTDGSNSLTYSVEVCPNPKDSTPIWVEIATAAVALGVGVAVSVSLAGVAMRFSVKATSGGSQATFQSFARLFPN